MMNRFGKLPPKVDYRTLRLANYITPQLPEPPEKMDNIGRVCQNTTICEPKILFPMDANDIFGDCTIAGAAHGMTLFHGLVGAVHIPTEEEVVKIYFHLSGGVDTGLYMLDVINYWRKEGVVDSKIFAFASVSHHNRKQVKQAIELFGGLYVGFQVQKDCMAEFNAHIPWKPGKVTKAGHCVFVSGYDDEGVDCLTWGTVQKGTWDWWNLCVDECYAILPPEAELPGFAPGFDFHDLKIDLAAVAY